MQLPLIGRLSSLAFDDVVHREVMSFKG